MFYSICRPKSVSTLKVGQPNLTIQIKFQNLLTRKTRYYSENGRFRVYIYIGRNRWCRSGRRRTAI